MIHLDRRIEAYVRPDQPMRQMVLELVINAERDGVLDRLLLAAFDATKDARAAELYRRLTGEDPRRL